MTMEKTMMSRSEMQDNRWKERMKSYFDNPFDRDKDIGSVVYWAEDNNKQFPAIYCGLLQDVWMSEVCVVPIAVQNYYAIDDVYIKDMHFPTPWKKLPKGWGWDTDLIRAKWKPPFEDYDEEFENLYMSNPEDIKRGLDLGILAFEKDVPDGHVEVDFGSGENKGLYRLVFKYDRKTNKGRLSVSLLISNAFKTFSEAVAKQKRDREDIDRIASLTDEEFAVEELEDTLYRYQKYCHVADNIINEYRLRLVGLGLGENLETRFFNGGVEWKSAKNKTWHTMEECL